MRHLSCSAIVATLALLTILGLPGCGARTPSASDSLAGGEPVRLVEQVGPFALIETQNGDQRYLPVGMLKQRNTAKMQDVRADFTHTIVRDTPVYAELPTAEVEPLKPRERAEIDQEQKTLNALFIGEETGKEVIAPGNVHYFVIDEETGERCWRSIECTNPDCPGEKTNGRPYYVFFLVAEKPNEEEPPIECDACLALRDLNVETPQDKTKWGSYVRAYEMPETNRRRTELDDERKRFVENLRKQYGQ